MSVFWESIQSVLSIVIMMAVGYVCAGFGWFDDNFSSALSDIIMKVALPCAIFSSMLSRFKISEIFTLSSGIVYSILSILIGYLISWIVVKSLKVPHGRRAIMMAGFNVTNTVFIGMPLNIALFGSVSLPYLLVYYIVNTVILWTFTVWTIAADDPTLAKNDGSGKSDNKRIGISWKHLLPAPLWGFIIAIPVLIIWPSADTQLPSFITTTLTDIGGLVTPLSLIYIGIMLRNFGLKNMSFSRDNIIVILGRFVVAPLLMIIMIVGGSHLGFHLTPMFRHTLIIQAATPVFAVLPILADQYHGDVKFATDVVVSTSTLFIIVVPILMWLITTI